MWYVYKHVVNNKENKAYTVHTLLGAIQNQFCYNYNYNYIQIVGNKAKTINKEYVIKNVFAIKC